MCSHSTIGVTNFLYSYPIGRGQTGKHRRAAYLYREAKLWVSVNPLSSIP